MVRRQVSLVRFWVFLGLLGMVALVWLEDEEEMFIVFFGSGADGFVVARGWKTVDVFEDFGGDDLEMEGERKGLVLL